MFEKHVDGRERQHEKSGAKRILENDILDTQTIYSIRLYCYGAVGMTREWLLTDNITPAETVVEMMFNSMPENIRRIFLAFFSKTDLPM